MKRTFVESYVGIHVCIYIYIYIYMFLYMCTCVSMHVNIHMFEWIEKIWYTCLKSFYSPTRLHYTTLHYVVSQNTIGLSIFLD